MESKMESYESKLICPREGYAWANRDESNIFYTCIIVTDEEDKKRYHEITLERAGEIVREYQKKYANV
jgi:hypothetical protein